ncbi:MAG: hypothetical protein AB1349_14435 [Elusimicrobiota bacterium]
MQTVSHMVNEEIRMEGWNALIKRLGMAGATRFLLEYQSGKGNYTKERKRIFQNKTVRQIAKEI